MMDSTTLDILKDLLAQEQTSIARRLVESTVFVSRTAVADLFSLRKIATANHDHQAQLTRLILEMGDCPLPRNCDVMSADLHFQELHHALPRLEADLEGLIRRYTWAVRRLGQDRSVAAVLSGMLAQYQEALASLETLRTPATRK